MTFDLAVCAEMVFTELPLLERIERIHAAGFAAEIWGWTDKDAASAGSDRCDVHLDDGLRRRVT